MKSRAHPTFVATFDDGETVRMTTHCDGEPDWDRGRNLAKHAWVTRDRRRRIEEFLANVGDRYEHRQQVEKFLARLEDHDSPEITSCHFDVDGQLVREPSEGAPAQ
jgi:hypothetical protein